MKPTLDFGPDLVDNGARFTDPFYRRFTLRPLPEPLRLNDQISKRYSFPTFYGDVTCAIGIFLCSYARAQALLPHPKMKPVRMTRGRSLVAFSCYEYRQVMGVPPYNEIAMTLPVMIDPGINVPVLPMVLGAFKRFGYYVFGMPVTSLENQIRGRTIWGLPKTVEEIDVRREGGDCVTTATTPSGERYFELRVPTGGALTSFDVRSNLYSRLGDRLLQSPTCFRADFRVTKFMGQLLKKGGAPDRPYLTIGTGPTAQVLRDLEIEERPFQFRYAEGMTSCFDLPNPDYRAPFAFAGA